MIEGARCSIVRGRNDTQQTWIVFQVSECLKNVTLTMVNSPHMRLYSSMLAKGSDT